jgi:hypothetical protein
MVIDGENTYYDIYNNNTSPSEGGTDNNLIELVESSDGDYVFEAGEKLTSAYIDSGDRLVYTFTVNTLTESGASITFTKR